MTEPNEVTFLLPRSHRSVPRARALLHAVLGDWSVGQVVLENAESVLSELVTNALRVPVPCGRQGACGSRTRWRRGCYGWR